MLANLLCLCKCLTLGQIKELVTPDANRRGVELVSPLYRFTREILGGTATDKIRLAEQFDI